MGQTRKNSVRAYVFRFALELGRYSMRSVVRICATSGHRFQRLSGGRFDGCCSPPLPGEAGELLEPGVGNVDHSAIELGQALQLALGYSVVGALEGPEPDRLAVESRLMAQ